MADSSNKPPQPNKTQQPESSRITRKATFSSQLSKVFRYPYHPTDKRGTRKGSQTLGHFKRNIIPKIRALHEKGAYGDKPLEIVLKEKKKEFIAYRTQTRRKERLPTAEKDATVAHYIAQLMAFVNEHNIKINYESLKEMFDEIEQKYTDPYICIKYKKAVLKHFIGKKKNRTNTLLNDPLTGSELSVLIERSKTCPEHHHSPNKIESASAAVNKSNKPASNNKPTTTE